MTSAAKSAVPITPDTANTRFISLYDARASRYLPFAICSETVFAAATGNPAVQFFLRDADNVDTAQALVLIGAKPARAGLTVCGFCGFDSCASADASGARCAFNMIDLGIAVGSAVSVAADDRVDSRVLYSAGKAAQLMEYEDFDVNWLAIPIAAYGKSPFFDRKPKK